MIRGSRHFLSAAALCLGMAGSAAHAHSLSIDPVAQMVGLGSEATVEVRVSDVLPDRLGAYDFELSFDGNILAFDRAIDGFGLGLAFGLGTTPGAASVHVSDFSFEAIDDLIVLQGGDFVLFSLVFDTLALGTSALSFDQVVLRSGAGAPVAPDALNAGSITVEARVLPEPATLGLVFGALVVSLLPGLRRRH
ncbi:cohesin domain-containing protein [Ideonella sp. A 288]|uniref:cohesin domain-containing protein n=1 Tax=Ideonella sp. A 288 TaxID=1962181 RepID=UPI000B4B14F2|nr:cohesin domain-containing protein [Ideonella sp. A 288]